MKAWLTCLAFLLLCTVSSFAQDFDRYFYLAWMPNKPLSNTSWIDEDTGKGVRFGYRKLINEKFAVGFDYTWATYDQYYPTATFVDGSRTITTDYFNYVYSYGLTVSGQYFLPFGTERVMPYAGLGIGASLNRYFQYYNIYTDNDQNWGFLGRPEVGVLFPFGGKWGLTAAAHYTFSTAKSDYFGYDGFNSIGFNVGVVMMSY
ncbi:MAG TPA: outer membrane beta-barrel protein [Cyclobacteriaceae bacterium]|nr:outer membrane beta-barrel protein [Cyclobacteriaceae bacterium]